jgi:hypothetical protein
VRESPRGSSGVVLILAQVPLFELVRAPVGLKLKAAVNHDDRPKGLDEPRRAASLPPGLASVDPMHHGGSDHREAEPQWVAQDARLATSLGIGGVGDWDRDALTGRGFAGWIPVSTCPLGLSRIERTHGGVYVVYREGPVEPAYLERSPAGQLRGDPTVDRKALDANWVRGARVMYVGKADHGRLRTRLAEFIDFGRGGKRRHWGGRLIWQLQHSEDLLIAWRVLPTSVSPKEEEDRMLDAFKRTYGKRPFANNPDRRGL